MFRKRSPAPRPTPRQAAPPPFPGPDHLRTSFRATFPDGRSFDYFILPGWLHRSSPAFMDKVVQSLPQPGLQDTALKNAAATYLKFALGCVDGMHSSDGDFEAPMLGSPPEYEVLEAAGIDLNDWVEKCEWEPKVFRDPRLGHRRVRDAFGLEEELLYSMHGVLRTGLWQSTYHLTDKALYVFGESHEDSCARFPLELFLQQTENPPGAFGPGNHLMYFMDPGDFDFGVLPGNSQRGEITSDGEGTGASAVTVAGFQIVELDRWKKFGYAIARALSAVLPTERIEVSVQGRRVGCLISKTIIGQGAMCFEDSSLTRDVAAQVRESDEYKEKLRHALASLPVPSTPPDVSALRSKIVAPPSENTPSELTHDVRDRLDRLTRLRDDGVISEEEYSDQRQRILDEL